MSGNSPRFTVPSAEGLSRTLAGGCLVDAVDSVRDISTQLGVRAYRVRLVWTQWSRGLRGEGLETTVFEHLLLPTPRLRGLDAVGNTVLSVGSEESGSVTVDRISARYTEDFLGGQQAPGGESLSEDLQFYWEVEFIRPAGLSAERRRFSVQGVPTLRAAAIEWTVRLVRAYENRARDGVPRG